MTRASTAKAERRAPEPVEDTLVVDGEVFRRKGKNPHAGKLVYTIEALRKAQGLTQVEMAERLEIDQTQVSRMEKRTDHRVENLARFVEAMGGKLCVEVEIGGRRYRLR